MYLLRKLINMTLSPLRLGHCQICRNAALCHISTFLGSLRLELTLHDTSFLWNCFDLHCKIKDLHCKLKESCGFSQWIMYNYHSIRHPQNICLPGWSLLAVIYIGIDVYLLWSLSGQCSAGHCDIVIQDFDPLCARTCISFDCTQLHLHEISLVINCISVVAIVDFLHDVHDTAMPYTEHASTCARKPSWAQGIAHERSCKGLVFQDLVTDSSSWHASNRQEQASA